jgi:WD40 repeat protein
VYEIAFSPDGATLAVAADNLYAWRLSDGSLLYEGGGRDRTVFSPRSDTLASASAKEAAFVWDLATGAFLRRMPVAKSTDFISSLTFESNGDLFVDTQSHGEIWDLTQGTVTDIAYPPAVEPPSYGAISLITPDGKWIVSNGDQSDLGAVRVWDTSTGTVARSFPAQGADITALVIDPSGTWLATTGAESLATSTGAPQGFDIKIWDFASGTLHQTLNGHTDTVFYLAFSPDGQSLLSGGGDGLVRLWSVADGSVIRDFAAPPAPNATPTLYGYGVVVSPDGRFVASGAGNNVTGDEFVDVWSTATGQLARRLALWGGDWWTMSWSPDGQFLVTNGPAAINVWCVGDL